ncbi:MAG: hypothetical protein F7C35_08095 [Desulfurococcales archaeon]|nr:hypothetical protein [Desulfurococcales archaeon]
MNVERGTALFPMPFICYAQVSYVIPTGSSITTQYVIVVSGDFQGSLSLRIRLRSDNGSLTIPVTIPIVGS